MLHDFYINGNSCLFLRNGFVDVGMLESMFLKCYVCNMIKWFKKNRTESTAEPVVAEDAAASSRHSDGAMTEGTEGTQSFYVRFKQSLSKTRDKLGDGISRLLLGKKTIDKALLEELETKLIQADLGVALTRQLLDKLNDMLSRKALSDGEQVYAALEKMLGELLEPMAKPLPLEMPIDGPFVILIVGVNGTGKTTTIAKLAHLFQTQGKKVMLAAGDTFRAAAVEQLQTWGVRHQIPVVAQHIGADSASVIFDAFTAAKSRGVDVLIADTAGRLHTQVNLMEELKKIKRVLQKIDCKAPHEIMLILDASIGQNALNQAREFHQVMDISGITMTKLDGTARGGVLFAIANELKIPFRYIGFGESAQDLRPFDASLFVEAVFHHDLL